MTQGIPLSPDERIRRRAAIFRRIEEAAAKGERCPTGDELNDHHTKVVPSLARLGWIRIEVYAANWRVITILTGEHAGKQTAPPPFENAEPYLVIDNDGTRRNGKPRLVRDGE